LPLTVDHRREGLVGPVRDQGQVGVCWAHALSSVLDTGLRRSKSGADASALHVISARRSLWHSLWQNTGPGSFPTLTSEQRWPYQPAKACKLDEDPNETWCGSYYRVRPGSWRQDCRLRQELQAAELGGCFRINRVEHLDPQNSVQLCTALAEGDAVWIAIGFNREAWRSAAVRDGVIDPYRTTADLHAVSLVGYRTGIFGTRDFLVQNSWGADWGRGGYAWISEHTLRRHGQRAFRVQVEQTRRGCGIPRPVPPPPPTCSAGGLPDLLTGACSAPCSGGLPPAGGFCLPGVPALAPSGPARDRVPCPPGQATDGLTGQCRLTCASKLPPIAGICWL